jgi:hypothetical protein
MVVQPKMDGKRILMLPLVFTMAAILNFLKRNEVNKMEIKFPETWRKLQPTPYQDFVEYAKWIGCKDGLMCEYYISIHNDGYTLVMGRIIMSKVGLKEILDYLKDV